MNDDKTQQNSSANSSSSNSNDNGNSNTGNDIPYVPPTDRTNLNETRDFDTKPVIPPIIKTDD